ncbi:MAG: VTT domain-containing protein [Pseudomonadota bacterium]
MVFLVRRLSIVLARIDSKAITSLIISVVLIAFVTMMLVFGRDWLNLDDGSLATLFDAVAQSPFAVLAVIAIFALLALTGFPQILLITASVVCFGPKLGAGYAWIATMVSASLTFAVGRIMGGNWVFNLGGARATKLIAFLHRRGAIASALIRVVPSAPFIVVNAAAGAANIPVWKYWIGTGIGIVPKIALVAVLGAMAPGGASMSDGVDGIIDFIATRTLGDIAMFGAVVGLWLGFLFVVRIFYNRMRKNEPA